MNRKISESDLKSLEEIERYINKNYREKITQNKLEKIGAMSGTNLKRKFKEKNKMNITEYIQRTRVNIGEELLLNTDLEINKIGKAVGYNSHSRFSELFKKYKGKSPRDIRK